MPSFGLKDLMERKKSSQEDRKKSGKDGKDTGRVINFCYRLIWIAYLLSLI